MLDIDQDLADIADRVAFYILACELALDGQADVARLMLENDIALSREVQ